MNQINIILFIKLKAVLKSKLDPFGQIYEFILIHKWIKFVDIPI